jgi:hypothetical protein
MVERSASRPSGAVLMTVILAVLSLLCTGLIAGPPAASAYTVGCSSSGSNFSCLSDWGYGNASTGTFAEKYYRYALDGVNFHNCTRFAAFYLAKYESVKDPLKSWGNAGQWGRDGNADGKSDAMGYPVSTTPRVGDVAWKDRGGDGSNGHVAIVLSIGSGTVVVAEDNYYINSTDTTGTSRVHSYTTSWFTGFIHVLPASLPAQPGSPRVVSTTGTSAVLSWTDASNNEDSFVSHYRIGSGSWVAGPSVGANTTSMTVTGLARGTSYTFQVGARNARGTHWSVYFYGRTVALPAQPTNVRVSSTTGSSANLVWTDASNNETSFVSQYRIGTGAWATGPWVGAGGTSMTIGGLRPATAYTFQIGARNVAGTHWSAYAYGTTHQVLPAQPSSPHVTGTTGFTATLAWGDASNNEDSFVTQYRVGTGSWAAGPSVTSNTTSVTVTGLHSGTAYTFQVGAKNSVGTHWSTYFYGTTVAFPAQPTNPRVTSTSSSSATLAWGDASNNENGFRTQYSSNGGTSWTAGPTAATNATSVTVGGLAANTTYIFQVGAYNSAGTHWSAYTSPVRTQANLAQYANSIVKQNNGSSTAWWVTSDLKRLWIPDGNTYNQLLSRYHANVYLLSSDILNQLPDQTNQWAASGASWTANREMRRGMSVSSANGIYTFVMQGDGNLVLYTNAGRALWASNTVGSGQFVIFQGDGNLVVYTADGHPVWASNTGGSGATSFVVQDDGNLVLYKSGGAVWASGTSQARSVQLKWGAISGHTGPGDNYAAGPTLPQYSYITILCYVNGSMPVNRNPASVNDPAWYNDSMWDRATDGYYYSDAWLATGSDNPVVPHC